MAKVVIDMPDYMLNQIMIGYPFKLPSQFVTETYKIIRNGKILPKGHGRLIDVDELIKRIKNLPKCPNGHSKMYDEAMIINIIDDASTIIEADKGG